MKYPEILFEGGSEFKARFVGDTLALADRYYKSANHSKLIWLHTQIASLMPQDPPEELPLVDLMEYISFLADAIDDPADVDFGWIEQYGEEIMEESRVRLK